MSGIHCAGEFEDLNEDLDLAEDLRFPLFEHKNAPAAAAQGEVKSLKPYHIKQDSTELYADQQSDYSITVQRLLWIDGHVKEQVFSIDPMTKQKVKQEVLHDSTLVVLKIQMHSVDPDQKFRWMSATLALEDGKRRGKHHPEVLAWAPWRELDRSNETVGHRETSQRFEAGIKGGYQGAEMSTGASHEGKISWEQTYFDKAHSTEVSKDGKPNGVRWFAGQNRLQDQGVKPEVWVSALFSRSSQEPYLVNFNIYAHAGRLSEFAYTTKRFFGLGPGRTKTFSITPGKQQIISREGMYMMESIDIADLGRLRDKTLLSSLNIAWGPSRDAEAKAKEPPQPATSAIPAKDSAAEDRRERDKALCKVAAIATGDNKMVAAAHLPTDKAVESLWGDDMGDESWSVAATAPHTATAPWKPPPNKPAQTLKSESEPGPEPNPQPSAVPAPSAAECARLAALEGRVANAEARIAAQDMLILHLQRQLITKDAQSVSLASETSGILRG